MMPGFRNHTDDEMSMEDILSSIRKFVSEEDAVPSAQAASNQMNLEQETNVISLDQSNVIPDADETPAVSRAYTERRDAQTASVAEMKRPPFEAEQVVPSSEKQGRQDEDNPFSKLTEALKAYTRPKKAAASAELSVSMPMNDFMRVVVERCFEKWAKDNNLKKLIEDIVLREIEKLKSE